MAVWQRRFTRAAPGALNTFANMTDDVSGAADWLSSPNTIIDCINAPDPAAGLRYEIVLLDKMAHDTGIHLFTDTLLTTVDLNARGVYIPLLGGRYYWSCAQRLGGLAAYSMLMKLAHQP